MHTPALFFKIIIVLLTDNRRPEIVDRFPVLVCKRDRGTAETKDQSNAATSETVSVCTHRAAD